MNSRTSDPIKITFLRRSCVMFICAPKQEEILGKWEKRFETPLALHWSSSVMLLAILSFNRGILWSVQLSREDNQVRSRTVIKWRHLHEYSVTPLCPVELHCSSSSKEEVVVTSAESKWGNYAWVSLRTSPCSINLHRLEHGTLSSPSYPHMKIEIH